MPPNMRCTRVRYILRGNSVAGGFKVAVCRQALQGLREGEPGVKSASGRLIGKLPYMMSTSEGEGGQGIEDVVREVALIL